MSTESDLHQPSIPAPAPRVLLVGPKPARRTVRALLGKQHVEELQEWRCLPEGPAVCIDARRLEFLSPGAIGRLGAALAAGAVVALPGSNASGWPLSGAHPPIPSAEPSTLREHAHRIAELADTTRVRGPIELPACFAVADAASVHGCPRTLDDLHVEEAVVVPSAWCHHRRAPFVSAAMIVKNEAAHIAATIRSAREMADEIVIYDTGSTDGTIEIARREGAYVQEGYWDDDFSRARNESFAMARGEWILVLDGDDEAVATKEQAEGLKFTLASMPRSAIVSLLVRCMTNAVTGHIDSGSYAERVFPRGVRWFNRVHEFARFPGDQPHISAKVEGPSILHLGYGHGAGDRGERNLRLTAGRLDDAQNEHERASARYERGRAFLLAGDLEEAERQFRSVIDLPPADRLDVDANMSRLLLALTLGRRVGYDEVFDVLAPLIEQGGRVGDAARWTLLRVGADPATALAMLDGIDEVAYLHIAASADEVSSARALMHGVLGDHDAVTAELRRVVHPERFPNAWIAAALALEAGLNSAADRLVNLAGPEELGQAAAALAAAPPASAHRMAVAMWQRFPRHQALVAYFANASPRAGFLSAVEARFLLAEADLVHLGDPLEQLLAHRRGDVADRLLAALVLDDLAPVGESRTTALADEVSDDLVETVVRAVQLTLPDRLPAAIAALSTSPARAAHAASAFAPAG